MKCSCSEERGETEAEREKRSLGGKSQWKRQGHELNDGKDRLH